MLRAALAGFGPAYLAEDQVRPHLDAGRLVRVLADWCRHFPGYYLDYPDRRQPTAAFSRCWSRHCATGDEGVPG